MTRPKGSPVTVGVVQPGPTNQPARENRVTAGMASKERLANPGRCKVCGTKLVYPTFDNICSRPWRTCVGAQR